MNQQPFETSPSMDLPEPQVDQLPDSQELPGLEQAAELPSAIAVEQAPAASQSPMPIMPILPGVDDPQVDDPVAALPLDMPHIAEDNDLIEKEWVIKAKQIVSQTSQDPYRQNVEMNRVKADYLKKRYNKDLKVSE